MPIVYAELEFGEDEAANANSPKIHRREEPSVYATIKME